MFGWQQSSVPQNKIEAGHLLKPNHFYHCSFTVNKVYLALGEKSIGIENIITAHRNSFNWGCMSLYE